LYNRISKGEDVTLYSMPSLEEEKPPESEETIRQNIEEIQRQAYEEGFASGEKAGFAEGEQRAEVLINRLEKIIEELTNLKEDLIKKLEPQVVDLAIAIARKIIMEEINTRPEVVVTIVKEALKKLHRMGTITIKINPALQELFMKKKSELLDIHKDIVFDVNSKVSLAGPVVVSETEEVVTEIESLLNNVIDDIKNRVEK